MTASLHSAADPALDPTLPAHAGTTDADDLAVEAMRRRLLERLFGDEQAPVYLGRFHVRSALGAGGMGVIFAAQDEKLQRLVALKVIRRSGRPARADEKERLLAEARALARLSHPNVVHVYEVGEADEDVFIVMEHVRGTTLQNWLAARRRTLPEILAVFVAAGRGLAAAHAAGIVHRDFKPSNVLVGDDGRICLIDFGLAHEECHDDGRAPEVAGTPAYMPPEVFEGSEVDARGDQFSFCVALFEAVYGRLPFESGVLAVLVTGRSPTLPSSVGDRAVPRWLSRLVARGLSLRPAERFSSLVTLLDALEGVPRRRRQWAFGSVAAGLFGGALAGVFALGAAPDPCREGLDPLAGTWDDPRRAALASALADHSGTPRAARWDALSGALDDYAERWRDARRGSCEATWRHGEQSGELLDRSMLCLDRARRALDSLLELVGEGDGPRIERAQEMIAGLPDPEECRDRGSLLASGARPPAPQELALVHALPPASVCIRTRRSDRGVIVVRRLQISASLGSK